jgi:hypothetical protein
MVEINQYLEFVIDGIVVSEPVGIKAIKKQLGVTNDGLAEMLGCKGRSIENWLYCNNGTTISIMALILLRKILKEKNHEN